MDVKIKLVPKYKWGKRSLANLEGVDHRLVRVVNRALSFGVMDISIICGLRTLEEQKRLYALGRTEPGNIITWTMKSKHIEGKALDVLPHPIKWDDHNRFYELAGLMKAAAKIEGVEIIWGGDWQKSKDLPHWEVR